MITQGMGQNQRLITKGMGFFEAVVRRLRQVFKASSFIPTRVKDSSILKKGAILKSWIS